MLADIFQVHNNCNLKVTLGKYKERSVRKEQKANVNTEIILQSIIQATSRGRNVYLEFCSHAVWVTREKRSEETKRGDPAILSRVARDYKKEPLNRRPGPLHRAPRSYPRGSPSGPRCISTGLTSNLTTHGPSSSITSGRGTPRLRSLRGSLPIGFAPHSCNQHDDDPLAPRALKPKASEFLRSVSLD